MAASKRLLPAGVSIDAETLMALDFDCSRAIIPGFLYVGLSILASRPKTGKSFLSLKLGLCLATGESFLGMEKVRCDTLILALEDTLDRIQDRLKLLPYQKPAELHFSTCSEGLPDLIFQELDSQISRFPNIKVIIIDTLQKIRHRSGDITYAADYDDLGSLKTYADEHGVAVLLLHHTRKAEAEDVYDRIGGTSGITGVADTMMVLERSGDDATLHIRGRECAEREILLTFHDGDWLPLDDGEIRAREEAAIPDGVRLVLDLMRACDEWSGTYKELLETLGLSSITERRLSQQMRDNAEPLSAHGIDMTSTRTNRGTVIHLTVRRQQ